MLIALLVSACATKTNNPPGDDQRLTEAKVRSILPGGWSLTEEGNTFRLTRSEKLWLYNPVQADVRVTREKWAKTNGIELTYQITLRFDPLIPKVRYDQLKSERAPFEKIVNEGAPTVQEWTHAVAEFNERKLPVYFTERYTIYAEKPDVYPEKLYPDSAADECRQVVASLDKLFNRYEPLSGKNSDFQVRK